MKALPIACLALSLILDACMFQRYTMEARRVVFVARNVAEERGRTAIETEHLLLGVPAADQALVARIGRRAGFAPDALVKGVDVASPIHPKMPGQPADMPLSVQSKQALDSAAAEIRGQVTPAHILLALFRTPGVAGSVLRDVGVTEELLRAEVAES